MTTTRPRLRIDGVIAELQALEEVLRAVNSSLDLDTVLATIISRAVQLSGTSGGVVYEYDEARQEFALRASHRIEEELVEVLQSRPVRLGEGATGQAALGSIFSLATATVAMSGSATPFLTAVISARMETAISGGVRLPM
jgi:GAF domain-containing protein